MGFLLPSSERLEIAALIAKKFGHCRRIKKMKYTFTSREEKESPSVRERRRAMSLGSQKPHRILREPSAYTRCNTQGAQRAHTVWDVKSYADAFSRA